MNEDKATRYHRLGRRAQVLAALWTSLLLAAFLASGASAWLRSAAARAGEDGFVLTVMVYVTALSLLADLCTLPFGFYRGFVLERRYGLSTERLSHWLRDHVKSAAVTLVFANAGAVFVYWALARWGEWWWVVAGIGYLALTVLLVHLAPVLLFPIFFTFKPLEKASLRERLTALAARAGARIRGVYEWTLSDRTRKANAALAGMGRTRRILLSDTLLAEYSDDEIEVILAHEMGHHVHHDIWKTVVADGALAFAGLFAAHAALTRAVPLLGLSGRADVAGLPVLVLAVGAAAVCVKPALNALSRAHERRADAFALKMTGNPSAFITAMKRLGQQNLAEDRPSRLVQAFFYTHPPIGERLQFARRWAGDPEPQRQGS